MPKLIISYVFIMLLSTNNFVFIFYFLTVTL